MTSHRRQCELESPVNNQHFARIIEILEDTTLEPNAALDSLCVELNNRALSTEISAIASHNLEMLSCGSSLALHRGDLVENGLQGLTSTHLVTGARGILLLSDFDPAILGDALTKRARENDTIGFSGRHLVLKIISDGELRLTQFDCEPDEDDRKITSGVAIRAEKQISLTKHSPARIFEAKTSTYRINDVVGKVLCLVVSYFCPGATASLRVDRPEGKVIKVTPSDHAYASVIVCLSTLPLLDPGLAREAAKKYADHPVFYIRWEAIRQFAALEGPAALPLIRSRLDEEKSELVMDGLRRLHDHLMGA